MFDLSLYLVTNRSSLTINQFKIIIFEAIRGGVTIVQLREKGVSEREYITIAKEVKALLSFCDVPLIINDNPCVAKEAGADGVHLGQNDCSVNSARSILGEKAIIGLSLERLEHAQFANAAPITYAAVGPIFDTKTKKDAQRIVGIHEAKIMRTLVQKPLVAIGGINESNISEVLTTGVDGVCVAAAIFDSLNPEKAAQNLKALIKEARHEAAY